MSMTARMRQGRYSCVTGRRTATFVACDTTSREKILPDEPTKTNGLLRNQADGTPSTKIRRRSSAPCRNFSVSAYSGDAYHSLSLSIEGHSATMMFLEADALHDAGCDGAIGLETGRIVHIDFRNQISRHVSPLCNRLDDPTLGPQCSAICDRRFARRDIDHHVCDFIDGRESLDQRGAAVLLDEL